MTPTPSLLRRLLDGTGVIGLLVVAIGATVAVRALVSVVDATAVDPGLAGSALRFLTRVAVLPVGAATADVHGR